MLDFTDDPPEVHVAQKHRKQDGGDRQHDHSSKGRFHLELSAFYYTAPTCCCCQARWWPCKISSSALRGNLLPLAAPLLQTTLRDRPPDRQGKVRDLYDFGDHLLLVATDRISAFDYILGSGIPDKGKVLTQISAFWFGRTAGIVANHVLSTEVEDFPDLFADDIEVLAGRSMLVRKTEPLPIECVARGYLSGS